MPSDSIAGVVLQTGDRRGPGEASLDEPIDRRGAKNDFKQDLGLWGLRLPSGERE